jgi:hypothetical protein
LPASATKRPSVPSARSSPQRGALLPALMQKPEVLRLTPVA